MKKPLALTLLTLTVALSACAPQTASNTTDTNTPSATASASATPTSPVTLEASRDAQHPEYAQGNDYATGMNGTEEQKPGTITTVQGDVTTEPNNSTNTAENPVVPNPNHTGEATDADKQKLTDIINALEGAPVISGSSVVAQPINEYKIKPADSKEQNGILSADKYAEIVILDDVAEGGEEYAVVAPQIKGNEADIRANGLRPITLNNARQAIKNNYNTRIQGFLHYEPNATYTGKTILVLHVKQANHSAYVKGGAQTVAQPAATNTPQ
jgi:hypothetical protein